MERKWKKITVLPVGRDTTPWIEDEEWLFCLHLVLERMEENQRRWLVGLLSLQLGHGGIRRISEITGMEEDTIRTGRQELANDLENCPSGRVRRAGAGRPSKEETDPMLIEDLDNLIRDDLAGDPSSGDTWVRQTLRQLAKGLEKEGHSVCHSTVRSLLKKKGIRCKPTANAILDLPTPTATGNSATYGKRKKNS
jgi:hypothetical protein